MPSFSRNDVILVAYPFSDRTGVKVRPAVVVSGEHRSQDIFVVPLTSKTDRLLEGEFSLADWQGAGLNVASVVKRGLYTIHESLVIKLVGRLGSDDACRVTVVGSLTGLAKNCDPFHPRPAQPPMPHCGRPQVPPASESPPLLETWPLTTLKSFVSLVLWQ